MTKYIDAFILVVPKKNIKAYKKLSEKAGKIWQEYGALDYYECVGEDLKAEFGLPFPKLAKIKSTETVVFSWILYKSRKHRDSVNKKVMSDERLHMDMKKMPFDMKKMSYGGFDVLIEIKQKKNKAKKKSGKR